MWIVCLQTVVHPKWVELKSCLSRICGDVKLLSDSIIECYGRVVLCSQSGIKTPFYSTMAKSVSTSTITLQSQTTP